MDGDAMSDNKDHPFRPGVEVALVTRGYGEVSYETKKVAKLYKTGRFVLDGESRQWRANLERTSYASDSQKEWRGSPTGGRYWRSYCTVEFVTDELRTLALQTTRKRRARAAIERIKGAAVRISENATDADISNLELLSKIGETP